MDIGFFSLHHESPLYAQIYGAIKKNIEDGRLPAQSRLPSIRSLAASLSVGKITVERAYEQLHSEGYIIKNTNARYTIAAIDLPQWENTSSLSLPLPPASASPVLFDFSSGQMDRNGFNFTDWKRYLGRTLEDSERLMAYGEAFGERALRQQICSYLFQSRGVNALPEQIIVGANAQVLLSLLCQLLDKKRHTIAFEDPGFKYGRQVFSDYGFTIHPISMTEKGLIMDNLANSRANVCYVSPSHQFPSGTIMSVVQRSQLLHWADNGDRLIIEDDYDSEFRYYGNPIPALKGLDRYDKVVYLGSFSKIIPPSIRVSYMLLPIHLLHTLATHSAPYNQTASTIDQLTLAHYIADGALDRQVRRLRKIYQEKRNTFLSLLGKTFGRKATLYDNKSGLFVVVKINKATPAQELAQQALNMGCKVAPIADFSLTQTHDTRILLYFSGIYNDRMQEGLERLHKAWI